MAPKDPYRYFRIEARELLEGLRSGVAGLGNGPADPARIPLLLRLAHTLKGAARVVRLTALSDHAHRFEEVLAPHRDRDTRPSEEQLAQLRAQLDAIAASLDGLDQPPAPVAPAEKPVATSVPAAPAATNAPASVPAPAPAFLDTVRLQVGEVEAVLASVAGASASLASLHEDFHGFAPASRQARLLQALAGRTRAGTADPEALARLQLDAGTLANELEDTSQRVVGRVDRLGRELQRLHEDTGRLRLIPTEALWSFLDRAVRDAAQTLGKRVRLETDSRTPRVDTPVFAALQEALLHLVRNAVAHGIEPESARLAAGKPAEALIRVRLEHGIGRLRVVCADDGRGIDIAAVRRAAVAKGWLEAAPAASLDMAGAIRLLLRGGVTTTQTATEISGRGVGLEAVRAAVSRLNGELTVDSVAGQGTTITFSVPVGLSSVEALAVESGGTEVLLPLGSVQRVARLEISAVRRTAEQEELHFDGQALPYATLQRVLTPAAPAAPRRSHVIAVIIQGRAGLMALGVDRVLGATEAVVRPLPLLAAAAPFVAGASLSAHGAPRLLLEAQALAGAIAATNAAGDAPVAKRPPLLVVDDSLTTRMLEQSILESAGYAVDLAVSAEDGLRRLQERSYGLVLVDVEMPGMDGFAFVEHVRRDPATRRLPIIMITSREEPGYRQRGLDAGAQDYVIKGEFDQRRLLRRIQELLT